MRFIHDLLGLNDGGEFARSSGEIYPSDLELKEENCELQIWTNFFAEVYNNSKLTSISGKNEKINIDKPENSETVSEKRIFCTVIR